MDCLKGFQPPQKNSSVQSSIQNVYDHITVLWTWQRKGFLRAAFQGYLTLATLCLIDIAEPTVNFKRFRYVRFL